MNYETMTLISIATCWLVSVSPIIDNIKSALRRGWDYRGRIKPLDCCLCLAWWAGLVYCANQGYEWQMCLAGGAYTSLVAVAIEKIMHLLIKHAD